MQRILIVCSLGLLFAASTCFAQTTTTTTGGTPFVSPFTRPAGISDEEWSQLQMYAPTIKIAVQNRLAMLDSMASPVPFVSLPLVPSSVPPGSAGLVLTVNGTQFVAGSVVNWNGMALATTFVSVMRLTAIVPASNVATAGSALVTVSSPSGGISNAGLFTVRNAGPAPTFVSSTIDVGVSPNSVVVADFNNDGKPDLAVVNRDDIDPTCSTYLGGTISILLGNGDGTFFPKSKVCQPPVSLLPPAAMYTASVGDFNHDGNQDLAVSVLWAGVEEVLVFFGNGDGTFAYSNYLGFWDSIGPVVIGDFDRDGNLDIAVPGDIMGIPVFNVAVGKGDGTFAWEYEGDVCANTPARPMIMDDFNRDGMLDLADSSIGFSYACSTIYLGKGDGTFIPTSSQPSTSGLLTGDFDADGIPDLAGAGRFMKGNGDGTFTDMGPGPDLNSGYDLNTVFPYRVPVPGTAVDLNGDNMLDVVAASPDNNVLLYLGNGNGTFQAPVSITVGQSPHSVAVGDFNGDGLVDLAVTNSGDNTISILLQAPTVSVALESSANPSNYEQNVTFTATVTSQSSAVPTGTVTFNDGATTLGTSSLSGGTAAFSTAVLAVGVHSINAVYSGDSTFLGSSASLNQTVNQAGTTTVVLSSLNPAALGQPVTFTATITPQYGGQVSGTVTFKDGSTTMGSGAVSGDVASLTTGDLTIGTHFITAVYSGDSNFTGSTSNTLSQVVANATTTTTLLSSINPSVSGKSVTFTATVSSSGGGTPTGKIEYLNGTAVLATVKLTSGSAKYTTSKLPPGSNSITSVYGGDSNNSGSTSAPLNQFVLAATTTTLASSPNPSTYGQGVVFTATVTSSIGAPPDGEVITFTQGTTVLGTGPLSGGTATFSFSALAVGTKAVKAAYGGDANFASSTSTADDQVIATATSTTALSSSQNPSSFDQPVTFVATVFPQFNGTTPTGSVTFYNGTATLGTVALINGVANYTTTKLAMGTGSITAVYRGSSSFSTSSSAVLSQVVNQASTTTTALSSLNPSNFGQSVTFTSTVAAQFGGTVTGSITFMDGTTTLKTVNLSRGAANYTTTKLASGTHNITATYNGSTSFSGSSASLTQTVN